MQIEAGARPEVGKRRKPWLLRLGVSLSIIIHLLVFTSPLYWPFSPKPVLRENEQAIPVQLLQQPQPQKQPQPQQREQELDQARQYAENPKADAPDQIPNELEELKQEERAVPELSEAQRAAREVEKKKAEALALSNTSTQGDEVGGQLGALIRYQLTPCWAQYQNSFGAVQDIEKLRVYVETELYRNGTLKSAPVVFAKDGVTVRNEVVADVVAQRARQAIAQCAPYRFPPEIYERWKDLKLVFLLGRWR